jgi:hypothetical protein
MFWLYFWFNLWNSVMYILMQEEYIWLFTFYLNKCKNGMHFMHVTSNLYLFVMKFVLRSAINTNCKIIILAVIHYLHLSYLLQITQHLVCFNLFLQSRRYTWRYIFSGKSVPCLSLPWWPCTLQRFVLV